MQKLSVSGVETLYQIFVIAKPNFIQENQEGLVKQDSFAVLLITYTEASRFDISGYYALGKGSKLILFTGVKIKIKENTFHQVTHLFQWSTESVFPPRTCLRARGPTTRTKDKRTSPHIPSQRSAHLKGGLEIFAAASRVPIPVEPRIHRNTRLTTGPFSFSVARERNGRDK